MPNHSETDFYPQESIEEINFLEALMGLILAPHETTSILFQTRNPPYGWTLFMCLLCSIFVPFFAQSVKYGYPILTSGVVIALTLLLFFGLLLFLIVEGLFLQILKVTFNMQSLFSCIAYALTPMILCLWLIYGFNYLSEGRLTMFTYLLTGNGTLEDNFLAILPFAFLICAVWILVVFFYSIKHMARVGFMVSFLVTALSLIPFFVSGVLSLIVGELVKPGTIEIIATLTKLPLNSSYY